MRTIGDAKPISRLLRAIAHPARLQILQVIGPDEACVCYLEAQLGWRQAYISQHLMALRRAGVLQTRRHGRFVYYRLADVRLLAMLDLAAEIAGVAPKSPTPPTSATAICRCHSQSEQSNS